MEENDVKIVAVVAGYVLLVIMMLLVIGDNGNLRKINNDLKETRHECRERLEILEDRELEIKIKGE